MGHICPIGCFGVKLIADDINCGVLIKTITEVVMHFAMGSTCGHAPQVKMFQIVGISEII